MIPLGILATTSGAAAGAYELISTVAATGSTTSISFISIPQTYKHLEIRLTTRSNQPTSLDQLYMTINGINGYSHTMQGNGSAVSSSYLGSSIRLGPIGNNASTTNAFSPFIISILEYASTAKNKTIRSLSGKQDTTSSFVTLTSGFTASTTAISSILLGSETGYFLIAGSRFSLYGIRG